MGDSCFKLCLFGLLLGKVFFLLCFGGFKISDTLLVGGLTSGFGIYVRVFGNAEFGLKTFKEIYDCVYGILVSG